MNIYAYLFHLACSSCRFHTANTLQNLSILLADSLVSFTSYVLSLTQTLPPHLELQKYRFFDKIWYVTLFVALLPNNHLKVAELVYYGTSNVGVICSRNTDLHGLLTTSSMSFSMQFISKNNHFVQDFDFV